ncbi:hypothetical protein [Picrophilus oshimae]|uniref:Hypothetical membrane associated protein n=1 Tax=Picrophilus torridus (strain ATCC 700027 / DSM 9790 / JCM 10055 / NBRC 100828 / KAW 2/3) TaxID=1122961 RepID=Q6L336_PICTO|nr:hypothetical protein [Picrophilus oshimae]AAT42615.1 hypothetical membrane associated protein [Picrophilus oshimae DSM 9789]
MTATVVNEYIVKTSNTFDRLYANFKRAYLKGTLYTEKVYTAKIPKWEDGKYEGDVDIEMHKLELNPKVEKALLAMNNIVFNPPNVTPVEREAIWAQYKSIFGKIFPVYALSERLTDDFIDKTYQVEAGGKWEVINGRKTLVGYRPELALPELNQVMINIIAAFQLGFQYKPPEGTVNNVPKDWIMNFSSFNGFGIDIVYKGHGVLINYYKESRGIDKFINNMKYFMNFSALNIIAISNISMVTNM